MTGADAKPRDDDDGKDDLREICALSVPAVGTLLAEPAAAMLETAVVGRALGTSALGALAICNALFGLALRLFNFLA
jgi:Na+-driven multidrug efflux pump